MLAEMKYCVALAENNLGPFPSFQDVVRCKVSTQNSHIKKT